MPPLAIVAYADAISSGVTGDESAPSTKPPSATRSDSMPMRWATSLIFSGPMDIAKRAKPVLDETASARAIVRVPKSRYPTLWTFHPGSSAYVLQFT